MSSLVSLIAVFVLCVGCIGYGSLLLTVGGVHRLVGNAERIGLSFIAGFGIIGWLAFFPGVAGFFTPGMFWGVALIGVAVFAVQLRLFREADSGAPFTGIERILFMLLALVLFLDVLEGISPAADADSLAYHFALPKQFLAAGQIEFVPRAVSGAIPLLIQMTYAGALGMGGELALTLWAMLTGWAPALLLYAFVRRSVSRGWALALAALFLTTPAVLYGGGNGQVEAKCAAFALACVAVVVIADRERSCRMLAIAGLLAGFFVGAKFFGLIFAGAVGLMLLWDRAWFKRGAVFGFAVLAAGFQWYLWNWLNTGDPVFPTLTNALSFPDTNIWTRDFGAYFSSILTMGELPLERSIINWIIYPVVATFDLVPQLEGGRTGLGVLGLLILPAAVVGILLQRTQPRESFLLLGIVVVFFTVWFFSGTTQRVRHLLSIYAVLLLVLMPAAIAAARQKSFAMPFAAGIAATLVIQLAGQALFSMNYLTHVFSDETREEFLMRNVPGANTVLWINRRLPPDARVGFMKRQLAFLIERRAYMMHPHIQVVIDTRPTTGNEALFFSQIQQQKLDHLLIAGNWYSPDEPSNNENVFLRMIGRMVRTGCLEPVQKFDTVAIRSRTLLRLGGRQAARQDTLLKLVAPRCPGVSG